jgi:hypothetical protein
LLNRLLSVSNQKINPRPVERRRKRQEERGEKESEEREFYDAN